MLTQLFSKTSLCGCSEWLLYPYLQVALLGQPDVIGPSGFRILIPCGLVFKHSWSVALEFLLCNSLGSNAVCYGYTYSADQTATLSVFLPGPIFAKIR